MGCVVGVYFLRISALDDLDNRRITNLFKYYHPVKWLYNADRPTIVQCEFCSIFFLCKPTSFSLLQSSKIPDES
jgi:hypothetical protein